MGRTASLLLLCSLFLLTMPAMAGSRFRVELKIPDAREPYVAVLKDTWGSYLHHRQVTPGGKAKFDEVPAGDFQLRVQFHSGRLLTSSFRVDEEHAKDNRDLKLELRARDAETTKDSLRAGNVISARELKVSDEVHKRFREAWKAMELGSWMEARKMLEDCVKEAPGYSDAWNNLGVVARRMDDLEAAEGHFRMALQLRPEAYEPHANLAEALSALEKRDEALAMARQALRLRPADAGANAMVGIQYFLAQRYAECVPFLEAAMKADPRSYYYPQISLAVAYEKLGRVDAAAASLEHWLQHHTTNPDRPVVEAKHRELQSAAAVAETQVAQ